MFDTNGPVVPHSPATAGEFAIVSEEEFAAYFDAARSASGLVSDATSPYEADTDPNASVYRLTLDGRSGYAIRDGYLTMVFSLVRGRGDSIVAKAVKDGAWHLDCFDGYLTELYTRHGFHVYKREANWTAGGPDVVFMEHCLVKCYQCGTVTETGSYCEDCRA